MLDSGAEGPGFKSQPRRCRVTVLGKLFTPNNNSFSITHSLFHSRLKTFLFCKFFPMQPFFFFFRTDLACMIPQTFTVTSEHIRFYFLVFLFTLFSCCFCAVD